MRVLVDNNLFPALVEHLRAAGQNAVHVRGYELQAASDEVAIERARDEERVLISADTDFGACFARQRAHRPSVPSSEVPSHVERPIRPDWSWRTFPLSRTTSTLGPSSYSAPNASASAGFPCPA